jgi:hypothetical protein
LISRVVAFWACDGGAPRPLQFYDCYILLLTQPSKKARHIEFNYGFVHASSGTHPPLLQLP